MGLLSYRDAVVNLPDAHRFAGYFLGTCPICRRGHLNFSLRPGKEGEAIPHCFRQAHSMRDIIRALRSGPAVADISLVGNLHRGAEEQRRRNGELALEVWHQSVRIEGTLAETYLLSRGIAIHSPALRYHPHLSHPSGRRLPAMVACVTHAATGRRIVAIHRTFLNADGRKAEVEPQKMALGPIGGGAVRLSALEGDALILAEGIETALTVLQRVTITTWATLGTAGLRSVVLPDSVRTVYIGADAGKPGELAAREAGGRFIREGRRARIMRPAPGAGDFNDMEGANP